METKTNKFVSIRFEEKQMTMSDLTDMYNEPRMFTKTLRWIKNCIKEVYETFDGNTTRKEVIEILEKHKIRYHYWCAMD